MLFVLTLEVAAFVLGLVFGSFLNVCISRLPEHKSLSTPRSHCPQCLATIRWYDNVPLLSWIVLRARCRNCRRPISWRYPAVELAFGLWASLFALRMMDALGLLESLFSVRLSHPYPTADIWFSNIASIILGFLLIGLLVMDWQTHTLPDAFTLTGALAGFVLVCCRAVFLAPGEYDIVLNPRRSLRMSSPGSFVAKGNVFMTGPEHMVLGRLLAIIAAGSILLLIRWLYQRLRQREGLGLGDAKLLGMVAAFLGFWPAVLALFLGVVLCGTYAVVLLARGRATAASRLPLGSFLAIGGLLAALFGPSVIAWYTSLL
jgi:leader peptidase (prepilin peptidase)/N-methyltransferase